MGYEENADLAINVFLDTIKAVPGVEETPEPSIRVVELGESTLNLLALYWINQADNDFFEVHSNVVKAVKEAAEKNDINLPYPVQTVFVRKAED